MTPPKPSRIAIPITHPSQTKPVPIVADGSVASADIGEGRHIPVLILDTVNRPDIVTMVRAHQEVGSGDVISYWSFKRRLSGLDAPRLILRTTKPSICVVTIDFDFSKNQGCLVDLIMRSQAIYLQPGRPGDRVSSTFGAPRISLEIPVNEVFEKRFRTLHEKSVFQQFRKRGMRRRQARQATELFFKQWRGVFHRPVPFRPQSSTSHEV